MLTKIIETVKQNNLVSRGDRVLCALSGGMDSSVMLDALIALSDELSISVCAAHLNHMLRGEDSSNDEEFAKKKCEKYGIDFISERADVNARAKDSHESVELAARNVRYEFLARAKEKLSATKIATAHNANDNLETILLNLARGSGIDGLSGIPVTRGDIIRPIISVSREEIEEYAEKNDIEYCVDKSNDDTVYSRNMLRHNAIPALLKVNSAAIANAYRTSRIVSRAADFISESARERFNQIALSPTSCKCEDLLKTEHALFAGVCAILSKNAIGDSSYTLSASHISDIEKLLVSLSPSGEIMLPRGLFCRREYDKLVFEKRAEEEKLKPQKLVLGENFWGGYRITVKKTEETQKIHNSLNIFHISCDRIEDSLTVRTRNTGDELKLKKRPRRTLKKLFIDRKIPKNEREKTPVITDGDNVVFVYGFGADERAAITEGEATLKIEIERI